MALRYYANAPATTLAASCSAVATIITVASNAGLPISYPYIMILDRGTASEEVVLVTDGAGTTLTVTRGYDSTAAFSHALGAAAVHGVAAIDHREANAHVNATTGVHGVAGALVGTTDAQTLSNKTLGATNTLNGFTPDKLVKSDATGKLVSGPDIPTGTPVGTTDSQTLTNKIISVDNNTINGLAADSFVLSDATGKIDGSAPQKAIPAGVVVGTSDAQTLTNKTLTSPTITNPTITGGSLSGVSTNGSYTAVNLTGAWTAYAPSFYKDTGATPIGNGTLMGRWTCVGHTVFYAIYMTVGSSTDLTSGVWSFTLPTNPYNWGLVAGDGSVPCGSARAARGATNKTGAAFIEPGTFRVRPHMAGDGSVTSTVPWTWAPGDILSIAGSYEMYAGAL